MPSNKEGRPMCRCVTCPCTSETANRSGLCNRCLDANHEAGDEPKPTVQLENKYSGSKSPYTDNPLLRLPREPHGPKTGHLHRRPGRKHPAD